MNALYLKKKSKTKLCTGLVKIVSKLSGSAVKLNLPMTKLDNSDETVHGKFSFLYNIFSAQIFENFGFFFR